MRFSQSTAYTTTPNNLTSPTPQIQTITSRHDILQRRPEWYNHSTTVSDLLSWRFHLGTQRAHYLPASTILSYSRAKDPLRGIDGGHTCTWARWYYKVPRYRFHASEYTGLYRSNAELPSGLWDGIWWSLETAVYSSFSGTTRARIWPCGGPVDALFGNFHWSLGLNLVTDVWL